MKTHYLLLALLLGLLSCSVSQTSRWASADDLYYSPEQDRLFRAEQAEKRAAEAERARQAAQPLETEEDRRQRLYEQYLNELDQDQTGYTIQDSLSARQRSQAYYDDPGYERRLDAFHQQNNYYYYDNDPWFSLNPWYSPYMASGWGISFGYNWGPWRVGFSPFYDPYWSLGWGAGSWHRHFWHSPFGMHGYHPAWAYGPEDWYSEPSTDARYRSSKRHFEGRRRSETVRRHASVTKEPYTGQNQRRPANDSKKYEYGRERYERPKQPQAERQVVPQADKAVGEQPYVSRRFRDTSPNLVPNQGNNPDPAVQPDRSNNPQGTVVRRRIDTAEPPVVNQPERREERPSVVVKPRDTYQYQGTRQRSEPRYVAPSNYSNDSRPTRRSDSNYSPSNSSNDSKPSYGGGGGNRSNSSDSNNSNNSRGGRRK